MRFVTTALASICLLFAVSSCEKKGLPDPEFMGVFVQPNWSEIGADATISPYFSIRAVSSSNQAILSSGSNSIYIEYEEVTNNSGIKEVVEKRTFGGMFLPVVPDTYNLYVYSHTADIPVTKFSASVAKAAGGINILSAPEWFFLAKGSSTVVADNLSNFTAIMKPQTRVLNLEIDAAGISNTIVSASAILEGVAGTLDIDTEELSNPSTTAFNFTVSGNMLTANLRLLGVIPSIATIIPSTAQKLTITLNTTDGSGSADVQTIEKYLGSDLANFNTDKTPLTLRLSL